METDIHELSAAYALDALDADELAVFEAHLARCAECQEAVAAFRDVAAELAHDVETPAPPAALRGRILVAARDERSNVVPFPRRRWAFPVVAAAAVAAGIAAVGLAFWAADLSQQLDDERAESETSAAALTALSQADNLIALEGANGVLAVDNDSGKAWLVLQGLDEAPAEKTYEAWVIEGETPVAAGLFPGGGDSTVVELTAPVSEGAIVAVTVEAAGGVDQPTQQPIITGEVTA